MAAALYFFSGAIFPIRVLPRVLRPIGFAIPVTYWNSCAGPFWVRQPGPRTLTMLSDLKSLGIFLVLTVALSVIDDYCDCEAFGFGSFDLRLPVKAAFSEPPGASLIRCFSRGIEGFG